MKTPWFMLYRAGDKVGDQLDAKGVTMGSSRLVGLLYFLGVFIAVAGAIALLHLIAPGSPLDAYAQAHFDALLYISLGAFGFYVLARSFWDSFWDTGPAKQQSED